MHTSLLVEINSNSVSAGIAGIGGDSMQEVIFSCRKSFAGNAGAENAMLSALERALQEVWVRGLPLVSGSLFPNSFDHVVITLSPPWCRSKITSRQERGVEIFESAPFGSGFITSSADPKLVAKIEDKIIKTFGIQRGASLQSFSYVYSKVFCHGSESELADQALLVRFAGQMTELIFVEDGNVLLVESVDMGPESLTGVLSRKLNLPFELASSALSLFAKQALARNLIIKIDDLLSSAEDQWQDKWKSFEDIKPQKIFFISEPSDTALAQVLLSSVLPSADIEPIRHGGLSDTKRAVGNSDEIPLTVLSAFSRMLV